MAFGDASEEDESEEPFLEAEKQEDTSARETKKDREEKLKMMMEDDGMSRATVHFRMFPC